MAAGLREWPSSYSAARIHAQRLLLDDSCTGDIDADLILSRASRRIADQLCQLAAAASIGPDTITAMDFKDEVYELFDELQEQLGSD